MCSGSVFMGMCMGNESLTTAIDSLVADCCTCLCCFCEIFLLTLEMWIASLNSYLIVISVFWLKKECN